MVRIIYISPNAGEGRGLYILNLNIIKILNELVDDPPEIKLFESKFEFCALWMPFRFFKFILNQFLCAKYLLKLCPNKSIILFSMGLSFSLALLIAKMRGIRTIYFISGLSGYDANINIARLIYRQSLFGLGRQIFPIIISNLEKLNYNLADIIVVESPGLSKPVIPEIFYKKPILVGSLFVDEIMFFPKNQLSSRRYNVGYFGALKEHKGVLNFIEAIPILLKKRDNLKFIIGGDGPERINIMKYLNDRHDLGNVFLSGNISHKKMPDYLNDTMILVIPSYGEGLPNIVLESMACGTLVLAVPIGGIPDVIINDDTGFLMENNSPECIASNVIRILEHDDLEGVASRARALIERKFTFDNAKDRWKKIIEVLGENK